LGRPADDEPRVSSALAARLSDIKSQRVPSRVELVMRDTRTGAELVVDVWPTTLEIILKSAPRHQRMFVGAIFDALHRSVRELIPDFTPAERRKPLMAQQELLGDMPAAIPWRPRWRRRADLTEDDAGQGLAEYALILTLVAIVAIVALLFLGGTVSELLSSIGQSI
jgi:Flp pilus assembly pilin Flp